MALDKQKILNELGSVVNQLQSADCGCMSKLFNNGHNPNMHGGGYGCFGGHCGGWGGCNPCAGEPHMATYVARCNPPKLIAETYNYYDQNIVKPAMQEVYNQLKSITPENTISNHPLASQMGAAQKGMANMGDPSKQGGSMPNQGQHMGMIQGQRQGMGGLEYQGHAMGAKQGQGQIINGMQGQPMNAMGGHNQGALMAMGVNPGQTPGQAMGNMMPSQSQPMSLMSGHNQGQPVGNMMAGHMMGETMAAHGQPMSGMPVQNPGSAMPSITGQSQAMGNVMTEQGQVMGGGKLGQPMAGMMPGQGHSMGGMSGQNPGQAMGGMMGNPAQSLGGMPNMTHQQHTQQVYQTSNPLGEHAAALSKFNEFFPGVMNRDLGYNPMEMAIRMSSDAMKQKAIDATKSAAMNNMEQPGSQAPAINQQLSNQQQPNLQQVPASMNQQQVMPMMNQQQIPGQMMNQQIPAQMSQQQIPAQMMSQQQVPAQMMSQQQIPAQMNRQEPPEQMMSQQQIPAQMMSQQQFPAQMSQQQIPSMNQQQMPTNMNHQQMPTNMNHQQMPTNMNQQQMPTNMNQQQMPTNMNQQQIPSNMNQQQQMNQQQINQYQMHQQQMNQRQQQTPSTIIQQQVPAGSEMHSTGATYGSSQQPPSESSTQQKNYSPQRMEPIIPADMVTGYNTLGQPVEMVPGNMYNRYERGITLPKNQGGSNGYSNVKSTVSKTSLIGNRASYKTPSRSQLQHLYNQYKGSQSFIQKNVQDHKHRVSASDGKLDILRGNAHNQHIPLERVGGDTAINNQINQQMKGDNQVDNLQINKVEHMGDMPTKLPKQNNHEINRADVPEPVAQVPKRCRNGLQDMVYTSYTQGASWTFHGSTPPRVYRPAIPSYK